MRDAILDLRRLLAGDEVAFGAASTRLRNPSARVTPVYLLASGPRMIELAGEIADGVLLFVGLHAAGIRAAMHHLETGAGRAGRSYQPTQTLTHDQARWAMVSMRLGSPSRKSQASLQAATIS